jgi:hypothetical protein
MFMGAMFLFILAYAQVHPQQNEAKSVKLKAEYIITLTWPDNSYDDIDLWMRLPDDRVVCFKQKDAGYATLERDDQGSITDSYVKEDGTRALFAERKEIITIRAVVSGRYSVATHMYKVRTDWNGIQTPTPLPYKIKVTLTRLNPVVVDIQQAEITVTQEDEVNTAIVFNVDSNGDVTIEKDAVDDFIHDYIRKEGIKSGEGVAPQMMGPGDR